MISQMMLFRSPAVKDPQATTTGSNQVLLCTEYCGKVQSILLFIESFISIINAVSVWHAEFNTAYYSVQRILV